MNQRRGGKAGLTAEAAATLPAHPAAAIPDAAARAGADAAARRTELTLVVLALAATAVWLPLRTWFDLRERYAEPFFALEKLPGQFDSPIVRRTLYLFILASLIYLLAVVTLARARTLTATAKGATLGLVAGPAIVCVSIFPIGALDVFNYLLDLRLQYHFDANPYIVTNPPWLEHDPFMRSAFMTHVPLFYGPAWLLFSGIPGLVAGFDDPVRLLLAEKVFNLLLLGATAWLIARAQRSERRRWLAAFVFLGNPLILFEGVANAHNDVMMALFAVAAVVALRAPARRWRWTAAPLLALSALVKLFAAALGPLFLLTALRERWPARSWLLGGVATVLVAVAVIAPFWSGGDALDGYRTGTELSQQMDHVSPLSLAQQRLKERIVHEKPENARLERYASHDVVPQAEQDRLRREFTIAFAVLTAAVLALWLRGMTGTAHAAAFTLILFSLLMTNLYPWYLIPIVALLALELDGRSLAFVIASSVLGLAYYPAYVWAHFNSGWPKYDVHLFLALFLTAPMVAYLVACLIGGLWARRHVLSAETINP